MNVDIKRLQSSSDNFQAELNELLSRQQASSPEVEQSVARILAQVARAGDRALYHYTQKFDGFDAEARGIEVRSTRLEQALADIHPNSRESLEFTVQRVGDYHQRQIQESWQ